MDEFTKWCSELRAKLVERNGPDGDKWAGSDEDCRDLFDKGYEPDEAASEVIYAAWACGCG